MPPEKARNVYSEKIHPIFPSPWPLSWCVETYAWKVASVFIRPSDEKSASQEPRTTSHAFSPPSGYPSSSSSSSASSSLVWASTAASEPGGGGPGTGAGGASCFSDGAGPAASGDLGPVSWSGDAGSVPFSITVSRVFMRGSYIGLLS